MKRVFTITAISRSASSIYSKLPFVRVITYLSWKSVNGLKSYGTCQRIYASGSCKTSVDTFIHRAIEYRHYRCIGTAPPHDKTFPAANNSLSLQRRLVRIGRRLEQHPALTVSSIRPIDHNHHKITRWRQSTALDRRNESYCTTAAPADASGAGTRRLSIRVHGPPDAHNKYNPSILL